MADGVPIIRAQTHNSLCGKASFPRRPQAQNLTYIVRTYSRGVLVDVHEHYSKTDPGGSVADEQLSDNS